MKSMPNKNLSDDDVGDGQFGFFFLFANYVEERVVMYSKTRVEDQDLNLIPCWSLLFPFL